MTTRIEICNRALTRIGDQPLQSETATRADVVLQLYAGVVATLTALTPWSFSRKVASLAREDATPPEPRKYQYKLPGDRTGPPFAVYDSVSALADDRPFLAWELSGDVLLTDAETILVRYQVTPAIDVWSPLFQDSVIVLLAAECKGALHSDLEARKELRAEVLGDPKLPGAVGMVARAIQADAAAQPSPVMSIDGGPLLQARF